MTVEQGNASPCGCKDCKDNKPCTGCNGSDPCNDCKDSASETSNCKGCSEKLPKWTPPATLIHEPTPETSHELLMAKQARAAAPAPNGPLPPKSGQPGNWKFVDKAVRVDPDTARAQIESRPLPTNVFDPNAQSPAVQGLAAGMASTSSGPLSIVELARSLKNNVDLIYEWVFNNIEYTPTYGIQKGGLGALIDGCGNSFDQADLMVQLLRQAGYTANYVFGSLTMTDAQMQAWLGADAVDLNIADIILYRGGIPASGPYWNGSNWVDDFSHCYVQVNIGGTNYIFDPSMKTYTTKAPVNLATAMGYNATTFMNNARTGATITADYVQNLNRTNVRNDLTTMTTNLVSWIKTNAHGAGLDDILGGRQIVQNDAATPTRVTVHPYLTPGSTPTIWTAVPNAYKAYLHLVYDTIDTTIYTDALAGKRLTLFFNASHQAEIRLDGVLVGTSSAQTPGSWNSVLFDARHPYPVPPLPAPDPWYAPVWETVWADKPYLLGNSWGMVGFGSVGLHTSNLKQLSASFPDPVSEPVLGETLAVTWNTWAAMASRNVDIVNRLSNCVTVNHHACGLIGWFDTPLTDIGAVMSGSSTLDNNWDNWKYNDTTIAMHGVALEAQVIKECCTIDGVSTTPLIDIAVTAGKKIFDGKTANWTTNVVPNLVGYSTPDLNNIKAWYIDTGSRVAIPENASITRGSWTGYGYYVLPDAGTFGIIQGSLKGSSGSRGIPQYGLQKVMTMGDWDLLFWPGLTPTDCVDFSFYNPSHCAFIWGTTCMCWVPTGTVDVYGGSVSVGVPGRNMSMVSASNSGGGGSYKSGVNTSAEPIDLDSGAYLLDSTDISVGSSMGLSFTRSYSSAAQDQHGPLGRGWRHNFMIDILPDTIGIAGMGGQTVMGMAPAIVEAFIAYDLQKDATKPFDKYITTALMTQWFLEQLSDNVALMQNGLNSATFVKMPDGTWISPAGDNGTLTNPSGLFKYTSLTGTVMNYNSFGHITTIVDPAGVTLTFGYDSNNKLTSVTNGLGRTLTLNYSATNGLLSSVSDGNGRSVSYTVDSATNNLTSVTDLNGKIWTYEYDQPGRMTKHFKPANPTTAIVTNVYDSLGRIKQQKDYQLNAWDYYFAGSRTEEVNPNGKSSVLYYNYLGKPAKAINQIGKKSTTTYDGQGRTTKVTAPEGNAVQFVYDNKHRVTQTTAKAKPASGLADIVTSATYDATWGKVKTTTDNMGRVTTFNYDPANGNLLSVVSPSVTGLGSSTVSMTYNARGQVLTVTSPDGIVGKNTYDTSTEKLTSSIADFGVGRLNLTVNFGYDSVGNLTSVQDPRGNTANVSYDVLRRVTQTTAPSPFSYVTKFTFDDNGNSTKVERQTSDPLNPWQTSQATYSADNKVLTAIDPQGNVTTMTYDTLQRLWKVTDAASRVVERFYDDANRISSIKDPAGITAVTYTYRDNGGLSTLKDARNFVTTYTVDGHDRADKTTYPDSTFEQVTSRDGNSNPLTVVTRSGATVTLTYDELNRVKTKAPASQPTVTTVYDIAGRVVTVSTPTVAGDPASGTFTNFYDTAGRFYKEQYPDTLSVTHELDANGNVTKTTYPDGYYVQRVFDQLNRLTDIKLNGAGTSAVQFEYDALSRRTKLTYENGCSTSYGFEVDNDMNLLYLNFVGSSVGFNYGFDNVNQMSMQGTTDPANYRWTPGSPATTTYATASNINQYGTVGGTGFTYSTDGSLTNDGVNKYEYNTERMLTRVRNAGTNAIIADYLYDPSLRQRQKNVGGTKTNYYYAGWQRLADYDGSANTLQTRYVYGTGLDEVLIQISSGGTKTYFHANHQGSVSAITNSSGAVTSTYKYSPFGESPSMSGTIHGYTGQRFDPETGLYYYKMRHYSPKLGRFLQADPIGYAAGLNMYAYCGNAPMGATDPMGLKPYYYLIGRTEVYLEKWPATPDFVYHSSLLLNSWIYSSVTNQVTETHIRIELFANTANYYYQANGLAGIELWIYTDEESKSHHGQPMPSFSTLLASGTANKVYDDGITTETFSGDYDAYAKILSAANLVNDFLTYWDFRYQLPLHFYNRTFLGLNSNQYIHEVLRVAGYLSKVPGFWGLDLPLWATPLESPPTTQGSPYWNDPTSGLYPMSTGQQQSPSATGGIWGAGAASGSSQSK